MGTRPGSESGGVNLCLPTHNAVLSCHVCRQGLLSHYKHLAQTSTGNLLRHDSFVSVNTVPLSDGRQHCMTIGRAIHLNGASALDRYWSAQMTKKHVLI